MDPEVIEGAEPAEEPTIETEVAEEPVNLEAEQVEEATTDEPTAEEEEFEELEWSGKKFKAPKGAKDGFLMHADYTKKTQEVSQTRKELEERAARISHQAKATEEEISARAALHHVDSELSRFKDFDWHAYQIARQHDPLGADEAWNYKAHLLGQKQELGGKISEAEQRRSSEAQQEFAKRMNDTQAHARSKGYTAETDKQVLDFAIENGADAKTLQDIMSPLVYDMLYWARIGKQSLSKPARPAQQQAQPLEKVGGKTAPARVSLVDADMDQYVALRKAQMAKKGR